MQRLTARWVRKAEADWGGAQVLAQAVPKHHDLICFHWQQMAEKYLKALLQELGQPVPKTHNLLVLLQLLIPHDPTLPRLRVRVISLSRFAVDFRYPGMSANNRQSTAAIRSAEHVRRTLRQRLNLSV